MTRSAILLAPVAILAAAPLEAQIMQTPIQTRAAQLAELLKGKGDPKTLFSPAFLAAVPEAQVSAIGVQLQGQLGAVEGVKSINAKSPHSGEIVIAFAKGTARMRMAVSPAAPHLIEGLLITGTEVAGDDIGKILSEMQALPGKTGFAVGDLGDGAPILSSGHDENTPMAIGSAFKLFILAELSRQVKAGMRKWSDVVPLTDLSLPSGQLQDWPKGSPLTVHSLAALMISQSDNSATDTLLRLAGRENVEALLPALGIKAPARNRPFLSTREAFALKSDQMLGDQWAKADERVRRSMLGGSVAKISPAAIDIGRLTGAPNRIDSVEWFASATDLMRTMNWLRRNADQTALDLLAINPGVSRQRAREFAYFGFKGGSEPGVINLTFLFRTKTGTWKALAASWNDAAKPIDEARFIALIDRALATER